MANVTDVVSDFGRFPRHYRERYIPMDLDELSEEDIRSVYRFNGDQLSLIANDLRPFIEENYRTESLRGRPLSALEHVIIAMKFYGHGSSFRNMSEQYGIGLGTVSRVVHLVTQSIPRAYENIVKLPTTHEECQVISSGFHDAAGIPNVIGCVDGCLIPIRRPTVNEHVFVCRKGYHAINAMFVCRADMRFTYVDASFPGATQDAAVFRESRLREALTGGCIPQGFLLGDSGYGLSQHLLTPVPCPSENASRNYNRAHRRTRNCVERAIGVLKSRFRCIDKSGGPLRMSPSKCANIVNAVSILHNLAIQMRLPSVDGAIEPGDDVSEVQDTTDDPVGALIRDNIISLFQ